MKNKEKTEPTPQPSGTGMTDKELKQLRRVDLLELLIALRRENEQLRKRIEQLEEQLADRTITMEKAGSIAEAALALNSIFEAVQTTADQYLDNVRRLSDKTREASPVTEEEDSPS